MAIKIGGTTVINDSRNISNVLSITGLTTPLSVAQGGTGLSAAGTLGNVITSDGSGFISSAPAGVTTGKAIAMAIVFGG